MVNPKQRHVRQEHPTYFVTRAEFDLLMCGARDWMNLRWGEYAKQYISEGVWVRAPEHKIENLKVQLSTLSQTPVQ